LDGEEASPVPTRLVALTVNVYVVPLRRPVTVKGLALPVAVLPPGEDVTVYDVTGLPPSIAGGEKLTVACKLPAVAAAPVGASGTVAPGTPPPPPMPTPVDTAILVRPPAEDRTFTKAGGALRVGTVIVPLSRSPNPLKLRVGRRTESLDSAFTVRIVPVGS
jgi:hypothetical protein